MGMNVQKEWRCSQCSKLMAVINGGRLHIRLSKGTEFFVGMPASGKCQRCGTLNEICAGNESSELFRVRM